MQNNFLICRRNILIENAAMLIERSWQSCKTRPRFTSMFRASQKSLQLFQGSSSSHWHLALRKCFLRSKLYTRVRSVALEIAFVRQGHSRSLDRSQLFDRSSAVTMCRNIRAGIDVSLKNKNFPRGIPVLCEDASEKVETWGDKN